MNLIQFVNETVFAFIEGLAIFLLFLFLIDKKDFILRNKIKTFLFLVFYTIFSYFSTMYTPPGFNTVFHFVFLIILFGFISKVSIFACTISAVSIIILLSAVEAACIAILLFVFRVDVSTLINSPPLKLTALLITKAILFILLFLLYRSNFHIPKFDILKKENFFAYFLLQIFTMTILVVSITTVATKPHNIFVYDIFIMVIYFLSIVLGFLDYNDRAKLLKLRYKLQSQEEYVRNMEGIIDVMHKEKHDFCNHLNTIAAICRLNKPDALQKIEAYVGKLTNVLTSPHHQFSSGNDYINGFLAVKSCYASKHNIDLDADFDASLSCAQVDDTDLICIVGNIIDNAIEAIKAESHRDERYISVLGYCAEDSYVLSISNNGPVIPEKVMERIFESGFSTKADTKGERGYGLHIVQHLVKRNGGEISISSSKEAGTEFIIRFRLKKQAAESL